MVSSIDQAPRVVDKNGGRFLSLPLRMSLQEVLEVPQLPALCEELLGCVPWQRRNEFTLKRGISSTGLLPGWVGVLLAWGADINFSTGEDPISVEAYLRHTEARHEGAAALRLPLEVPGRVWADDRVARAPADSPIVYAVAVLDVKDQIVRRARLAITGVWKEAAGLVTAVQKLEGKALTKGAIEKTVQRVRGEISPQADFLGSVEYRRAMAAVLTRRVLRTCLEKGA